MQLDEYCLELSQECKEEIAYVLNKGTFDALQRFSDKFGALSKMRSCKGCRLIF